MLYLVDTGVLLRVFDASDPLHPAVVQTLRQLRAAGHTLVTTPQNMAEFWNVSTRPNTARGGYGQSVATTDRRARFIERFCPVLSEPVGAYAQWRRLVLDHGVTGVKVHDARLVATMQAAGISHILTLNDADFRRFPGIIVIRPGQAIAAE